MHDFYYKPMFIKKFGKILTFAFCFSAPTGAQNLQAVLDWSKIPFKKRHVRKIKITIMCLSSDAINDVEDIKLELPWFLECNPRRYPYWTGKPDPRNEIYFEKIKQFARSLNFQRFKMCPQLFEGAIVTCFQNGKDMIKVT